ncbi:MAG: carboxypeptidase regulatory-like domain-containing protein [Candidatus Cloacimonadaceae bacterium]|nr:carboxypeptidase regulatory-like domain-containing protein [Candidatus Cloacimonadota bacterium]MCK9242721.1 carboxypeptidase regulatory-like domain-containing protein [Candidatus Cloacimonadota bacterium]MDY0127329.1 carboxypeptidase regulatory-like domain-containing protein [Candidatus Cloacimonadaceae bacterium]
MTRLSCKIILICTLLILVESVFSVQITLGDGTTSNSASGTHTPYGTWYRNFRQQYLILSSELNALGGGAGQINSLAFNVEDLNTCSAMPNFRIRLKQTNQIALNGTFEPGDYTQVFSDNNFLPVTGWNTHTFSTPFTWDGTSNIIVDVVTSMITGQYSQNASVYYTGTNFDSCLRYQSDSNEAETATVGSVSSARANMRFIMAAVTGDPIFLVNPEFHYFDHVTLGDSRSQSFTIMNVGGGTLEINDIGITGSPAMTLSNLPALPAALETAESTVFTVTYTPYAMGEDIATVSITDNQDTRTIHTIQLMGDVVNEITIGDGSQTARVPFDFYYRNSLFETIYTADEMNNFIGMITGLRFYNQFSSNLSAMPVKIWLGSTTQTDLSAGWIPSTQLTQVFDGTVNFPFGENVIDIIFPEPYPYVDEGNLVMMTYRPMSTSWYSSNDNFFCQTQGANRSREAHSDGAVYNPASPPDGTTTGIFPKTSFIVIPGGVGHVSGTVSNSAGEPLSGVELELAGSHLTSTTDANGGFFIANLLPDDYVIRFSKHTYISQTVNFTLEEDETQIIDITMPLMPQVNVSGIILASDTGLGIAGANIRLNGYVDYSLSSGADGSFTSPEVFADQSYEYVIFAAGYTSRSGSIDVGSTDYNMGDIALTEIAYAPNSVQAEFNVSYDAINLSWNAPDPSAIEIIEGFESSIFPPADWTQVITNQGNANPIGVFPTWCSFAAISSVGTGEVNPPEGLKQAGLWWDYNHQDEWLITPSFNCPPDAHISFETYLHFGSPNNDHYYVKVSTNGGITWTVLWDGAAQPEGLHNYEHPITISLRQYGGLQMQLAFHAEDPPTDDGLWFEWFIDNIYIGNFADRISFEPASDPNSARSANRALQGYKVWRLTQGQEANESSWSLLTDELISNTNFSDQSWNTLENGSYKWAIKSIYTADVISVPVFSNTMVKEMISGNIVGIVRKLNGQGITGATVFAGEGHSATTNSAGAFTMSLPAGVYTLTASAEGYKELSIQNITVTPNQNTTVNFTLESVANENEILPVTVTALNANYPNPFNPTTTISYDLKEAGWVRLDIYNLKGQLVRTLANQEQPSGRYRIVFDAFDQRGNPLASGIYFYRMQSADYISTRKMLLME